MKIRDGLPAVLILLLVLAASLPNLRSAEIDDLDSAHHLMDSYFFNDIFHDRPTHIAAYATGYHRQYPALGFLFWPPLVPFVLGIFHLLLGPGVLTARIGMLFFGAVFGLCFYAILRRSLPPPVAFAATSAAITVPGIVWSFNQVMLELPTLAVMFLAVLAFLKMLDHREEPTSVRRAIVCAVACAAVIYAKQPAWFLYPVLGITAAVGRSRVVFRKAEPWIVIAAVAVLSLPLAAFTLKFGHANLAQSVGSHTQLIMPSYRTSPRWSIATWIFYPAFASAQLNPVLVLLTIAALILSFVRKEFRETNRMWLAWFVLAYATFSYYDNRGVRHATFWWPAWIALAASLLYWVMERVPARLARGLPALLIIPSLWQLHSDWRRDYTDFRQARHIVAKIYNGPDPGNILLFGPDKQTFVALIREYDGSRRDYAIRGERLLEKGDSVLEVCQEYRVRTVLIEIAPQDTLEKHPELLPLTSSSQFNHEESDSYQLRGTTRRVLTFHYTGPLNAKMAEVPLSDNLL